MKEDSSGKGTSERRKFLKQLLGSSMATLALPVIGNAAPLADFRRDPLPAGASEDERYWEMVKKQFSVPSNLMMVNAANLCPSPYFINDLVSSTLRDLEKDVSFQFRKRFADKRPLALEKLSQFIGASKDEIGIVRNTTEANNIVVNGLDLKVGDEVIIWDQNHPSNNAAWENRARRGGFKVKKITVPASPKSRAELLAAFVGAVTNKTVLISFSHISNVSGIALPAKEICEMARAKKIMTLVDGAQSLGVIDLNLKEMGCDFYSSSTHKWLMGPLENGILYVHRESIPKLWPNVISAGWKETTTSVDEKLCILGQRNETTPFVLPEVIDFHLTIGKKTIERRVRNLNEYLRGHVQSKIPAATFLSPLDQDLSAGITFVNLPGKQPQDIYQKLYENHGIAGASAGGIRFSPHIYNTMEDMDRIVAALATLS